ncbi:MAG TPA: hypothetical protein VFF78_05845, partial [Anaerolineaceae bacterium]|nr:hypothetical protein [Anaerolineaceae bacterium]
LWNMYSPQNITETYGNPSRIGFHSDLLGKGPEFGYQLFYFYDDQGFMILYNGSGVKDETEKYLHACPVFTGDHGIYWIDIIAQSSGDKTSLESRFEARNQVVWPNIFTIEQITGLSIDEFTTLIKDVNTNSCFDVSIELLHSLTP